MAALVLDWRAKDRQQVSSPGVYDDVGPSSIGKTKDVPGGQHEPRIAQPPSIGFGDRKLAKPQRGKPDGFPASEAASELNGRLRGLPAYGVEPSVCRFPRQMRSLHAVLAET